VIGHSGAADILIRVRGTQVGRFAETIAAPWAAASILRRLFPVQKLRYLAISR